MNDTTKSYVSPRSSSMGKLQRSSQGESYKQVSPTGNDDIIYKLVYLPSNKIKSVIEKSEFNKRSWEYLNPLAVDDISESILNDKTNTNPVKAHGTIDNMVLMEGLRRTYVLSQIDDGKLAVWLTSHVSKEDEAIIVARSDQYKEPTTVDLAITLFAFKKNNPQQDLSVRGTAKLFDVSQTTAQNAISLGELHKKYFDLFPTLSEVPLVISMNFATALSELSTTQKTDIIDKLVGVDKLATEKVRKVMLNELKGQIKSEIAKLSPGKKAKPMTNSLFTNMKLSEGVNVVASKDGKITIKLSKDVNPDLLKKIADLVASS
jgi:Ni,Fe-hydrogenase maturation factor